MLARTCNSLQHGPLSGHGSTRCPRLKPLMGLTRCVLPRPHRQSSGFFNSNATCIEVDGLKFTDELLPPAVLAYASLGLSDKDIFSTTKITRATDARYDDDGVCWWAGTRGLESCTEFLLTVPYPPPFLFPAALIVTISTNCALDSVESSSCPVVMGGDGLPHASWPKHAVSM
jgi:hypothetical protein